MALPILVGIALHRTLSGFFPGADLFWIKWPNDIMSKDGKLAGILVEGTRHGDFQFFVVGVGINLSQELSYLADFGGVTLSSLGKEFAPDRILLAFLKNWDNLWLRVECDLIQEFQDRARNFLQDSYLLELDGLPRAYPVIVERLDESGGIWVSGKEIGRRLLTDARGLKPIR